MLEERRRTLDGFPAGLSDAYIFTRSLLWIICACCCSRAASVFVLSGGNGLHAEFSVPVCMPGSRRRAAPPSPSRPARRCSIWRPALNACGYDADLAHSDPVRAEVRARCSCGPCDSRAGPQSATRSASTCRSTTQRQRPRSAQYVSLSLYLSPPPSLAPTADETDMPPDALAVVNVLPLCGTSRKRSRCTRSG